MKYITTIGEKEFTVELLDDDQVKVDGKLYHVDFQSVQDQPVYSLLIDGKSYEAYAFPEDEGFQVVLSGYMFPARVEDERERRLRLSMGKVPLGSEEFHLKAPMPGLVVSVAVEDGQAVQKGDVLVILESMKMQNELKSPRDGAIHRLKIKAGDRVEQRQTLLSVA
jgi:biotin carboxyl carrier protein